MSLNNSLQNHSLCNLQREVTKDKILHQFEGLLKPEGFNDLHYSLRLFTVHQHLLYSNYDVISQLLKLFSANKQHVKSHIEKAKNDISHSLFSLVRPGSSSSFEDYLSLKDPDDIIEFEKVWHPEYQRYSEHIYNHLVNIPLSILGKIQGKDYISPTLSNRIKILKKTDFNKLTDGFKSEIRNAISHGDAEFSYLKIIYHDRHSDLELTASEFSKLFDSLVDICNSIAIATLIFLCNNFQKSDYKLADLPLAVVFLYLNGYTCHPGYEVQTIVESKTVDDKLQLNIFSKNDSSARQSHIIESLHTAWAIQRFQETKYERFGISIDCGKDVPSSIFLDGIELQKSISEDLSIEASQKVINANLLWHESSTLARKLYVYSTALKISWEKEKKSLHEGNEDLGFLSHKYEIKHFENKSVENIRRIEVYIYLKSNEFDLTAIAKNVIRKFRRKWFYSYGITKRSFLKRRPSYIWLKVFLNNDRIRRMKNSNWSNSNFLCKAEWISSAHRDKPVFIKNEHFSNKNIRFKLNPNVFDLDEILNSNNTT